jgi:lipoprotein-anchoring transpeptidase ErfK/SrfK
LIFWQNSAVPILRKKSSQRRRGRVWPFGLLLALLLGGFGWLHWHNQAVEKNPRPTNPAPGAVPKKSPPVQNKNILPAVEKPVTPLKPLVIPPAAANDFPRPVRDVLEAQIVLMRRGISAGSVDGAIGSQTRAALAAFQRAENLPATAALDADTKEKLQLAAPWLVDYTVATNDIVRLQPIGKTWLEKSQQSALDYETLLELVAERAHAHPVLIQKLNPGVDWAKVAAETVLKIPEAEFPEPVDKAAFVVIHLSEKFLEAFDSSTNLILHCPCSIAAKVEKRPVGELHVAVVAPNPNYTFDPAVFPESLEAQALGRKLILPPGPNNPVGAAWIGLDKPGYGMHGTPGPEQVGRTESHGCFRLANWNAEFLLKLVWVGMPVRVEP